MREKKLLAGWIGAVLIVIAGCSSFRPGDRAFTLRVMTYNIHHGEGVDGTVDIRRIADHILAAKPHVVALQEVDRRVDRSGGIDIMTELSEMTGLTYAFGKTLDYGGGDYGNGVLTAYPIFEERNHLYSAGREGEQRGLLQLVIEVRATEIVFMNTHLEDRDEADRLAQIQELKNAGKRYESRPIILCGDFNDIPGSASISSMSPEFSDTWEQAASGPGLTFPASDPEKRIDYVFLSQKEDGGVVLRPISSRVMIAHASDHLPVLVEFELEVQ